jgi:ATP-dependent Lhr-like helicase
VQEWFLREIGVPTDVQRRAWPVIAKGGHALITAPTGSGKTLTAFLWALNQLITGRWSTGTVRVLYVSPLKALNNDIQRNLLGPLNELRRFFSDRGVDFPSLHVLTRSGDTAADERRRMLRQPPEILITTPESLNIILSSVNSRKILQGLVTVILDEIHAIAGQKRGTHLITAVDRLVRLSGEFQRLGLSATVRPLKTIAQFLGGYRRVEERYLPRQVEIIESSTEKSLDVRICFPEDAPADAADDSWWSSLVESFKSVIRSNRSTLLFANSRGLAEKVARLINEREAELLAYSHHGSLSKEIRRIVEEKLKSGGLSALVATSSLELGIDIGDLDEVILIQTPLSVASGIQRTGRSGHRIGQTSRARIYPTHGRDFAAAVVMAQSIMLQDVEEMHPVHCPLDVLAQILVSMVGVETWDIDSLHAFLKTSYPYHDLSKTQFNLVLEMLAGRYADSRIRELRPRITLDRLDRTVTGKSGVLSLVYMSGGTIPDRGYYALRLSDTKAKIGELDEEFVWERSVGETFSLGTQSWRIVAIDHQNVEVIPASDSAVMPPFWKGEERHRSFVLSEKIALALEDWNSRLERKEEPLDQGTRSLMTPSAYEQLLDFLHRQRAVTGAALPHRRNLLIEHVKGAAGRRDTERIVFHTLWGGRLNRPFALALSRIWEERYGYPLEVFVGDDAVMANLPHELSPTELLSLVTPSNLDAALRKKLETTGYFGALFRICASTALLLPRRTFKSRTPLWLTRLRAKKLQAAVMKYEDFPILLETWRTCLQDEYDLENLKRVLSELRSGVIRITEAETSSPSPFAAGLVWKQTNHLMYQDDTPTASGSSSLMGRLVEEVAADRRLRPRLPEELITAFTEKLHRTAPGYAPASAQDLLDWLKERMVLPKTEWPSLASAIERDHDVSSAELLSELSEKAVIVEWRGGAGLLALESLPAFMTAFGLGWQELGLFSVTEDSPPFSAEKLEELKSTLRNRLGGGDPLGGIPLGGTPLGGTPLGDIPQTGPRGDAQWLETWLQHYGPVPVSKLPRLLPLGGTPPGGTPLGGTPLGGTPLDKTGELLDSLRDAGGVLIDLLSEGALVEEVCDRENLERLLYLFRRQYQRPKFDALESESLCLFIAAVQGLTGQSREPEDLKILLGKLFGFPLSAGLWEQEIFPARLSPYYPSWLDGLIAESDLIWMGRPKGKLFFCFQTSKELFSLGGTPPGTHRSEKAARLFPDPRGRYAFWDLVDFSQKTAAEMTEELWKWTWKGWVSNSTYGVIRRGIEEGFQAQKMEKPEGAPPSDSRMPSRRFSSVGLSKWKSTRPLSGFWFLLSSTREPEDALAREELTKERIDQLFDRYGILFREILASEIPQMRWSEIFRTLRIMELSGEIFSGHFFKGIPGLQFASSSALRLLQTGLDEDTVFWMNAMDPASLCGVPLESLKGFLPRRIPSNHLVFHGKRVVLVSRRYGRHLEFRVGPNDLCIPQYLEFFKTLLSRSFRPLNIIKVESINSEPAGDSPYGAALKGFGFTADYKTWILRRRFR